MTDVPIIAGSQRPLLQESNGVPVGASVAGFSIGRDAQPMKNALSVDVEDYFQVEAFKSIVDRKSWESRPARVLQSTNRVLDIFAEFNARATFFILGWIAERYPALVERISAAGHEVASHGYGHENLHDLSAAAIREDVHRAKSILEQITGKGVLGYRAPTFSIGRDNWWVYEILAEEGYKYSSSIYPIAHDLYGVPDAPRAAFFPVNGSELLEIPVATVKLWGANRPCGGGGYFRLLPYRVSRWSIARVNRTDQMPCVFYCHPWEFDVGQPRISNAPLKSRLRHYLNINLMSGRVSRLLRDFSWGRIDDIFVGASEIEPAKIEGA
jgi:polysaccharide deacetylase family protein (PEP-CTERM system associated)